jgi:hypothetical protein
MGIGMVMKVVLFVDLIFTNLTVLLLIIGN